MGEVVKLYPHGRAEDPDNVLESAKGEFKNVLIIGYDEDGDLDVRADLGTRHSDALWMVEKFRHKLLNGDYDED